MNKLLAHCPIVIEIPVAWGEMDAFQHVNNIIYFRYFESARLAYFEKLDLIGLMNQTGIGPILGFIQCKFKIPLTYPDTVSVGTRISHIGEDRFTMEYVVVSHKHQKIAAEGEGIVVAFDYRENKKATVSKEWKRRIAELEKKVSNQP
ncbi:thioesterase III [Anaerolineae bacterium]|nr:thioesterase III [Anaerolineae bacterium]